MQFDYAGPIGLPDGRYLFRPPRTESEPSAEEAGAEPGASAEEAGAEPGASAEEAGADFGASAAKSGGESVLVIRTDGAPPPPRRRRRRPKGVEPGAPPESLPLTRVTAIRAFEPFAGETDAGRWLREASEIEETADSLIEEASELLNRALHTSAVAAGDRHIAELDPAAAAAVRIGYGSGEQVAEGEFSAAAEVDMRGGGERRRRRGDDLRPLERLAAVLGGRESLDACETMLLRARADIDGGRWREAALQLRVGLEALLSELAGALTDPGHDEDMAVLGERRGEAGDAANMALEGDLDDPARRSVSELTEICERVLRRRRVLRG